MKFIVKDSSVLLFILLFSQSLFAADYTVAVRAHHGVDAAVNNWTATVDVLNKQLSPHTFTLKPILNLNEITDAAARGEFDFVLTNPSSFVELEQLHGAKALATLNNKRANTAQDSFGSVIFTHAHHTDILKLSDLKDKTLMAVSKPAFGGWRVAWLEMLEQDFDPEKDLKALIFAKNRTQAEVVWAVRDGKADAGVVRTDLLERLEAKGKIDMRYYRIINNKDIKTFPFFLSTKLYPEWAFAATKSVPTELVQQVQQTLHAVSPDSLAAKKGNYVGWVPARDYSLVNKLMKKLKVGPYAQ